MENWGLSIYVLVVYLYVYTMDTKLYDRFQVGAMLILDRIIIMVAFLGKRGRGVVGRELGE